MNKKLSIKIQKAKKLKKKPPDHKLVFGTTFTDHMFVMDYDPKKGWHGARIMPYGPFEIEPAMATLHYAQTAFEGMKAFRQQDGNIALFRPEKNIARLNHSSRRLCIPEMDEKFLLEAVLKLIQLEKAWVPHSEGTSLYIRPFVFALEPFLGVRPARVYRLMVILSPVGAYYSTGFAPVKILVEEKYARAANGGTGDTKAAGNYAASLLAAEEAHKAGFTQVLWLDSAEHKYVEEVGTMNIAFVINNELVTPPLGGSILGGITRDSVLALTRAWGIPTHERPVSIKEVYEAADKGNLNEVFGTGTAAVISAVGEMKYKNSIWKTSEWKPGPLASRLFEEITAIQYGRKKDPFGWMTPLPS